MKAGGWLWFLLTLNRIYIGHVYRFIGESQTEIPQVRVVTMDDECLNGSATLTFGSPCDPLRINIEDYNPQNLNLRDFNTTTVFKWSGNDTACNMSVPCLSQHAGIYKARWSGWSGAKEADVKKETFHLLMIQDYQCGIVKSKSDEYRIFFKSNVLLNQTDVIVEMSICDSSQGVIAHGTQTRLTEVGLADAMANVSSPPVHSLEDNYTCMLKFVYLDEKTNNTSYALKSFPLTLKKPDNGPQCVNVCTTSRTEHAEGNTCRWHIHVLIGIFVGFGFFGAVQFLVYLFIPYKLVRSSKNDGLVSNELPLLPQEVELQVCNIKQ